jgi:glutamine synthetase
VRPTVNSYKRLVVGRSLTGATWAPAYISYGDNNRSAMVRIPHGRLELRLPDGACNPYLATAAVIAAGLDGIERNLDPGAPHNENLYDLQPRELKRRHRVLPQNLHEALLALEKDDRDVQGAWARSPASSCASSTWNGSSTCATCPTGKSRATSNSSDL